MSALDVVVAAAPMSCPACGALGPLRRHATRESWWRDAPSASQPQIRRGHIERWRCPGCAHTHSRGPDWAVPGRRITWALLAWIQQAQQAGQTPAAVARLCGLDDKTVRTLLAERAGQAVRPQGAGASGVKSVRRGAGRDATKALTYCT
jgi:hypothetical protein